MLLNNQLYIMKLSSLNSVDMLIETAFYIEVKKNENVYLTMTLYLNIIKIANSYCEMMGLWYNSEHIFMIGGIY